LGHPKIAGYEFWEEFRNQVPKGFVASHEADKALEEMEKVRYESDIEILGKDVFLQDRDYFAC